jgi:hypothetical protein
MFRVSGPHYVSVYEVNGCTVSLFGDIHFSKAGACEKCTEARDCMNIVELYKRLKQPTDIFLESPYYDKKNPNYKTQLKQFLSHLKQKEGWLIETEKEFQQYMYGSKHKTSKKVHVHYGDIRHHDSLDLYYWIKETMQSNSVKELDKGTIKVTQALLQQLRSKYHFKKIVDAMIKSNHIEGDMEKVFGKTGWLYAGKSTLTTFPELDTKVHRIRKQILKLSPKLQKAIIRYHEENATDILEDYHCYHYAASRRKFLKHLQKTGDLPRDESKLVIDTCIEKWFSHLMEIYMIARMVYSIEQGNRKNVSMFTGANHTYAVNYFFKNYLQNSAKHLWEYDSEQEKSTNVRCVYMPNEIIQSMIK